MGMLKAELTSRTTSPGRGASTHGGAGRIGGLDRREVEPTGSEATFVTSELGLGVVVTAGIGSALAVGPEYVHQRGRDRAR